MTAVATHPYRGLQAGLATRHQKLSLIGPALASAVGLEVVSIDVDTDMLGTFAGEVPRPGTQWQTAVAKARLGMRKAGLRIGIASEGTFGPLDGMPFVVADLELVVLVDDELGIEIGESSTGVGLPLLSDDIAPEALGRLHLAAAGFPEHGLIVRPSDSWHPIAKGIHDADVLEREVARCAAASPQGTARVESDLRAPHHPSRRDVIAAAAERLAARLQSLCATCGAPGWGVVRIEAGAPCSECGTPTSAALAEVRGCARCGSEEAMRTAAADGVDPGRCPACNP